MLYCTDTNFFNTILFEEPKIVFSFESQILSRFGLTAYQFIQFAKATLGTECTAKQFGNPDLSRAMDCHSAVAEEGKQENRRANSIVLLILPCAQLDPPHENA